MVSKFCWQSTILFIVLNLASWVFVNAAESNSQQKFNYFPGAINCIGKRCSYRLLNASRFSANSLIRAAEQSLSGIQSNGLDAKETVWIGASVGLQSNLEVAFSADTSETLTELKDLLVSLDQYNNGQRLDQLQVTLMVYHVQLNDLSDFGIGIDGFFRPSSLLGNTSSDDNLDLFPAAVGALTGTFGGLNHLLRLRLNALESNGLVKKVYSNTATTYDGGSFLFQVLKQSYLFSGSINPEKESFGVSLTGQVFVNGNFSNEYSVTNVSGEYAFFGAELAGGEDNTEVNQGDGNTTRTMGPQRLPLNLVYREFLDGQPRAVYELNTGSVLNGDSIGTFFGTKSKNTDTKIMMFLTIERIPENRSLADDEKVYSELEALGRAQTQSESSATSTQADSFFNESSRD